MEVSTFHLYCWKSFCQPCFLQCQCFCSFCTLPLGFRISSISFGVTILFCILYGCFSWWIQRRHQWKKGLSVLFWFCSPFSSADIFNIILTKTRYFYPIICLWITLYLTLHLVFQPFKYSEHNYIFTAMLFVLLGRWWGMGSVVLDPVYPPFSQRPFSPLMLITIPLILPSIYLCRLVGVLLKERICICSKTQLEKQLFNVFSL